MWQSIDDEIFWGEQQSGMRRKGTVKFNKDLYWGDSIKHRTLVKWRLFHGKRQPAIYCIMRAMAKSDQLDIMNSQLLQQPYYEDNPAYIYGIASGHEEALKLVVRMTEDASRAGFDGRILDFLNSGIAGSNA